LTTSVTVPHIVGVWSCGFDSVTVAVPGLLELGFSQLGLQLLSVPVPVAFAGSAPLGAVGQFCHTMLLTTFSAPNVRVVGWPLPLIGTDRLGCRDAGRMVAEPAGR
jgi:hypothetical protein